jgi:hypothetical protein
MWEMSKIGSFTRKLLKNVDRDIQKKNVMCDDDMNLII